MRGILSILFLFVGLGHVEAASSGNIALKIRLPLPGTISDLTVVSSSVVEGAVLLRWSAVGRDGASGQAVRYEIACSKAANIENDQDWRRSDVFLAPSAQCFSNSMPIPQAVGSQEIFIATGLRSIGATYYFAVRAVNDLGRSGLWSRAGGLNGNNWAAASDLAPAAPQGLQTDPEIFNTAAQLFWQKSPEFDLAVYRLWRTSTTLFNAPTNFSFVAGISTNVFDHFDSNLINGVTYYYRLTAIDVRQRESPPSSVTSLWTHPPVPLSPQELSILKVTTTSAYWVWRDSSVWESGYRLIEFVSGQPVSPNLSNKTTQYIETDFTPGQFVEARAVEAFNISGTSASVSLSTWILANAPIELKFTFAGTSNTIVWNTNNNAESVRYEIQRSTFGISWSKIAESKSPPYLDFVDLPEGATVSYRVRAFNGAKSYTSFAGPLSTTTARIAPAKITDFTAVTGATEGRVDLYWTAPGDDGSGGRLLPPSEFRIFWSTSPSAIFDSGNFQISIGTQTDPGSRHGYTAGALAPLAPGVTYYFSVITLDEQGHAADFANLTPAWAQWDVTPPLLRGDFAATLHPPASAYATWTAPGDDGWNGAFSGNFLVGYGSRAFTSSQDFLNTAIYTAISTSNAFLGLRFSTVVTNIVSEGQIYMAMVALDERANTSALSEIVPMSLDNVAPPDVLNFYTTTQTGRDLSVRLNWRYPNSNDLRSGALFVSTYAYPNRGAIAPGAALPPVGAKLADGSVALATFTVVPTGEAGFLHAELSSAPLALYVTYYYMFIGYDAVLNYSLGRSTFSQTRESVRPAAPAVPLLQRRSDGLAALLTWVAPKKNADGLAFSNPQAPQAHELSGFEVYISTYVGGSRLLAGEFGAAKTEMLVPAGLTDAFYVIRALDIFGNASEDSSIVDGLGNLYAASSDGRYFVQVGPSVGSTLRAGGNAFGKDLVIRAQRLAGLEVGLTFAAARFWVEDIETGADFDRFKFPEAGVRISLSYGDDGKGYISYGQPLRAPAAGGGVEPQVKEGPVRLRDATSWLGLYWDNGKERVKIYGAVDEDKRLVYTETSHLGTFYIQKVLRALNFDMDVRRGVVPRVFTPNNDGVNDLVFFQFDNPKDSGVSAKIFDTWGAFVAELRPGPRLDTLIWDGRDFNGSLTPGGVYVYQIESEGKVYNGTVVVAR